MPYTSFVIGFSEDDPRRYLMREHTILAGRCGSCRKNTYLNPSGVDCLKTRDTAVYCSNCAHLRAEYDHMVADLAL